LFSGTTRFTEHDKLVCPSVAPTFFAPSLKIALSLLCPLQAPIALALEKCNSITGGPPGPSPPRKEKKRSFGLAEGLLRFSFIAPCIAGWRAAPRPPQSSDKGTRARINGPALILDTPIAPAGRPFSDAYERLALSRQAFLIRESGLVICCSFLGAADPDCRKCSVSSEDFHLERGGPFEVRPFAFLVPTLPALPTSYN
jgi:hypothetical protein